MLKIGNKVFRNLQEQVGYNTTKIEEIFKTLDGLNVQDNVVAVSDISQVLTDDEMEIVRRTVAFIAYNGELYIKKGEDASTAYFDIIFSVSEAAGVITVSSKEIRVTLANGGLALVTSSEATYSRIKLDALLAAKADLDGANFTGPITASSIVENMSGYSLDSPQAVTGITVENVYISACKNGNKLTLVSFLKITKTDAGAGDYGYLTKFIVPASVGEKISPYTLGSLNAVIENKVVQAFSNRTSYKDLILLIQKPYNTAINFLIYNLSTLDLNTPYMARFEATFLLNDSL